MKKFSVLCAAVFSWLTLPGQTVWEGEKIIDKEVVIAKQDLLIKPGCKVIFKGKGELIVQQGSFSADGAEFTAENPVEKQFRIRFSNGNISLKNCTFDHLICKTPARHIDGSIRIQYAKGTVSGNTFNRSSAIALLNSNGVTVENNQFTDGENGILLFNSGEHRIVNNSFVNMSDFGIRLNGSELNQLANNRFENCTLAVFLYNKAGNTQVTGNSIFGGKAGIKLWHSGSGNVISANLFENVKTAFDAGGKSFSGSTIYANNCIYDCLYAFIIPKTAPDASVLIRDNAICKTRVAISVNGGKVTAENNLFWQVKNISAVNPGSTAPEIRNSVKADPLFKDAANGDYRPADNSPLLKNGTNGGNIGLFQ
ncbi:MAG: right-handed parallel beta-helix repeat-containing protein [Lentisphaeria bacterium]|nr:right-handed parallel beta-helix repeat-containing protein [Lentisphaeria bacterium]